MLGGVMTSGPGNRNEAPSPLGVVALLKDLPGRNLTRGQVGTAVERLGRDTWIVEFADDEGRADATVPCQEADLLVLRYVPELA